MKTIAMENLVADTILYFCENLAELGCPKDAEPDMWFRELSGEERYKVGEKLLEIIERPPIGEEKVKDAIEITAEREVKMVEMDLDIEDKLADKLAGCGLEMIRNDRDALINYFVNNALREIVETDGKCLRTKEDEEYELPFL